MPYKDFIKVRECKQRWYLKHKNDPDFIKRRHKLHGKKCPECNIGINDDSIGCRKHKPFTDETRKKIAIANTGKKQSWETLEKLSKMRTGRCPWNKGKLDIQHSGENHWNWQGGITPLNQKIRQSLEYKLWRDAVFERDDFTCQLCGEKGGRLRANHIKRFADCSELRLVIRNGITICEECDLKFVFNHEPEWESYFNFNLMTRGVLWEEDKII